MDSELHVSQAANRVGIGRDNDLDARLDRPAHVLAAEVQPVREPVHLERDARFERHPEHLVQVERILRPVVDDPPLRVAQAADVRVPHRLDRPLGQLARRHPLPAMDARLHPLELGQHVVRQIQRAIAEDVALAPTQDPKRRQPFVRSRDLLALATHVVGGQPGNCADARRVVADGQVLVAALARRLAHLEHARLPVRPGRMAVEVAADVG